MFFERAFGVVSTSVNLFECSLNVVAKEFQSWQLDICSEYGGRVDAQGEVVAGLSTAVRQLFPLQSHGASKYLFFTINDRWCGMLDNGWRGTDASAAFVLAKRTRSRAVRALSCEHRVAATGQVARYGGNILELVDSQGDPLRSIYCANDGGRWVFGQQGAPLDFESPQDFAARRIRDKFGRDQLCRFLAHLGVAITDLRLDDRVASQLVEISGRLQVAVDSYAEGDLRIA